MITEREELHVPIVIEAPRITLRWRLRHFGRRTRDNAIEAIACAVEFAAPLLVVTAAVTAAITLLAAVVRALS